MFRIVLTTSTDPAPIIGPYGMNRTTMKNPKMDSTDQRIDVYYPSTKGKYPLIAYSHGFDNEPTDYSQLFEGIVSFGYIVTAHWACHVGCADDHATIWGDPPFFAHYYRQQLLSISFAKDMAAAHDPVFSMIDFSGGVGVAGHSMGGQSSLFSSSYDNATQNDVSAAVMHHAFSNEFPAPQVPFLAFTGTGDDVASPKMTENFFKAPGVASLPRGFVNKKSAVHYEPENGFFPFEEHCYNPLLPQFTAAWFKLHIEKKSQEFGIDFEQLIYGNGGKNSTQLSICEGGDGELEACEMH